jgi:hypothetical protein
MQEPYSAKLTPTSSEPEGTTADAADASELIKYESHGGLILRDAKARLEAAQTVKEVNQIREAAEAMAAYAAKAKKSELLGEAEAISFFAKRKLGQLMAAQKATEGLNSGTAGKGRPKTKIGGVSETLPKKDERPTLAEAGIDKNLAKRARKAAALSETEAEEEAAALRAGLPKKKATKKAEPVTVVVNAVPSVRSIDASLRC